MVPYHPEIGYMPYGKLMEGTGCSGAFGNKGLNIFLRMIAFYVFCLKQPATSLPLNPSTELTDRFQYNIWEHLAVSTNVSNFCLTNKLTPDEILGSCVVPVCHNTNVLLRSNSTEYIDYSGYSKWGTHMTTVPDQSIHMVTPKVGSYKGICVQFRGCTNNCFSPLGKSLTCAHYQYIYAHHTYVLLPLGWFFSCGTQTYNYIPPNIAKGVSCCLTRLTVVMPTRDQVHEAHSEQLPRVS